MASVNDVNASLDALGAKLDAFIAADSTKVATAADLDGFVSRASAIADRIPAADMPGVPPEPIA